MSGEAVRERSSERRIAPLYRGVTLVVAGTCFVIAAVVGTTVGFHDWDSMVFSEWSRLIFEHPGFHYPALGAQDYQRPGYYVLQGYVWVVLNGWWGWGRLLSLGFTSLLVVVVTLLAVGDGRRRNEEGSRDWATWSLAILLTLSVTDVPRWALSSLTDIPVAALVGSTAVLAFAARRSPWWVVLTAASAAAAMLTKPSALPGVVAVMLGCLIGSRDDLAARIRFGLGPVAAGLSAGIAYGLYESHRLHLNLWDFWRAGISGRFEASARVVRMDALVSTEFVGPYVRVVAVFGLFYALFRCLQIAHRRAAGGSVVVAAVIALVGPRLSDHLDPVGVMSSAEVAVVSLVLLLTVGATVFADEGLAPSRPFLGRLLVLAVVPLTVWLWKAGYETRLSSAAWPGVLALAAATLAPGVRQLARSFGAASLVPLLALVLAVWGGLTHLDGFDSGRWRTYRSLGATGIWRSQSTDQLFSGALMDTVKQVQGVVGEDGRILTTEARIGFFTPGRVTEANPRRCSDLVPYRAFVLRTDPGNIDEMERVAPGTSSASFWAACRAPALRELSDGSNGYAIFEVIRA